MKAVFKVIKNTYHNKSVDFVIVEFRGDRETDRHMSYSNLEEAKDYITMIRNQRLSSTIISSEVVHKEEEL